MLNQRTRVNHTPLLLFLFVLLFSAFNVAMAEQQQRVQVVYQYGDLFLQDGDEFIAAPQGPYSVDQTFRIGEKEDAAVLQNIPEKLEEAGLVLSYGDREMITLSTSSTVKRLVNEEQVAAYQMTGAVHLFIKKNQKETPVNLLINGIPLTTAEGHFFFNDLGETTQLTLIEGTATATITGKVLEGGSTEQQENAAEVLQTEDATTDVVAQTEDATTDVVAQTEDATTDVVTQVKLIAV
ncbi:MAG: hypothetical protein COB67_12685, partial [SAR324 cluster bacterium]